MRFWPFFALFRLAGVDVLEPDEHPLDPRALRLGEEARDAVAEGVHLEGEAEVQAVPLAELDQPVEDRAPVLVAGEVVVGDEEPLDPLVEVRAHDALHVVRIPEARLAALHVDDRAEAALERAPTSSVEARLGTHRPTDPARLQDRGGGPLDRRQVAPVVVEDFQPTIERIAQDPVQAALRLSGEQGDPLVHRLAQLGGDLGQHRQGTADVKPTDAHGQPLRAERPRQVHGPGELVGLDSDQADEHPTALRPHPPRDRTRADPGVRLVDGRDPELDPLAQSTALRDVGRDAVQGRQAVRGHGRANPLDHVPVVVVVGGLDSGPGGGVASRSETPPPRNDGCGPAWSCPFANRSSPGVVAERDPVRNRGGTRFGDRIRSGVVVLFAPCQDPQLLSPARRSSSSGVPMGAANTSMAGREPTHDEDQHPIPARPEGAFA